jgi:cell division protein FtsB
MRRRSLRGFLNSGLDIRRSFEHQARLEAEAAQQQAEAIAIQERNEKLQERNEKLQERNKNEKLAAYLRSLGINPDEIP